MIMVTFSVLICVRSVSLLLVNIGFLLVALSSVCSAMVAMTAYANKSVLFFTTSIPEMYCKSTNACTLQQLLDIVVLP